MKKHELTAYAQAVIKFVTDNPKERNNLVEWAESYLDNVSPHKENGQNCQWCERHSAALSMANQTPFGDIDLICRRCFHENLFDYLDSMKDVRYP